MELLNSQIGKYSFNKHTAGKMSALWHMDKTKGEGGGGGGRWFSWGGVEGWGEKAYNCNWITIKILKNNNKLTAH